MHCDTALFSAHLCTLYMPLLHFMLLGAYICMFVGMYMPVSCHPFCMPHFIEKQLKSCVLHCIIELCQAKVCCKRTSCKWHVLWHATYAYTKPGMLATPVLIWLFALTGLLQFVMSIRLWRTFSVPFDKLINIYCCYILKLALRMRNIFYGAFFP